jgi:hypothetical protein
VTQSATVAPERPNVRVLDPRPVQLELVIDTAPVDRIFSGVPVVPSTGNPQALLTPSGLAVTLSGPAELLRQLEARQLRVVAQVPATLSSNAQLAPVHVEFVELPERDRERVRIKGVSQAQVTVRSGAQRASS